MYNFVNLSFVEETIFSLNIPSVSHVIVKERNIQYCLFHAGVVGVLDKTLLDFSNEQLK